MLGAAAPVSAIPLVGAELAKFSVLSGGYVTYGANTNFSGEVGAMSYITDGADSTSAGNRINTAGVKDAHGELTVAKNALTKMGRGTELLATMGGEMVLGSGVYSASALTTAAGTVLTLDGENMNNPFWVFNIDTHLVTGASTTIKLINAGKNASVVWNTGSYVTIGASTSLLGAVMSGAYISLGDSAQLNCGNLYAASYVTTTAGLNATSSKCAGVGTWAGSEFGLGSGLDIVDGTAQPRQAQSANASAAAEPVPEPGTIPMLLLGLGLIGVLGVSRKAALRRCANNALPRKTAEPV